MKTFGQVKAAVARSIGEAGVNMSDPFVRQRLNEAVEELAFATDYPGFHEQQELTAIFGEITLDPKFIALLAIATDGMIRPSRGNTFEFNRGGPGPQRGGLAWSSGVFDRRAIGGDRKYFVPHLESVPETTVLGLVRRMPQPIPEPFTPVPPSEETAVNPDDHVMEIGHVPALVPMVRALEARDRGDLQSYENFRNIAIRALRQFSREYFGRPEISVFFEGAEVAPGTVPSY